MFMGSSPGLLGLVTSLIKLSRNENVTTAGSCQTGGRGPAASADFSDLTSSSPPNGTARS